MKQTETKPCEFCGKLVTRTAKQQENRIHWTCGRSCSAGLAHRENRSPDSWQKNPYRGQKETRPCAVCGIPETRYITLSSISQEWACSPACAIVLRTREGKLKPRTGDTVNCLICGKEFYRQPAYIKQNRRFCSVDCNNAWQARNRITKNCLQCGKEFTVPQSQKAIRFCSKPCESTSRIKYPTGRVHNGWPVLQNEQGYLTIYEPTHPNSNHVGHILEHRFVMSQQLGRALESYEHVHHVNHVRNDNRPENLEILGASEHGRETNAFTSNKRRTESDELAEYRRRFGKLE